MILGDVQLWSVNLLGLSAAFETTSHNILEQTSFRWNYCYTLKLV